MSTNYPRLFIAIRIDHQLKKNLLEVQAKLKQAQADIRWVKIENIHFTLRFIGEVNQEIVSSITNILKQTTSNYNRFDLTLKELGVFPNINNPRVIWVSGKETSGQLPQIYNDIETGLVGLGLPKGDHSFSPHITIGRIKSRKNIECLKDLLKENTDFQAGIQSVTEIILFESQLKPAGPIYTVVDSAGLKTK